ncbi:hypothetical protein ElyMa_000792600 [Elysia marginata]|uniref:Uncharacterized protein n=1 Tax=Elysia marginata TaxID=1093978 RepID=A0AAV4GW72_9GAST|nr:hypothetical protein ElyMa_000792600 [Elysia marginata]
MATPIKDWANLETIFGDADATEEYLRLKEPTFVEICLQTILLQSPKDTAKILSPQRRTSPLALRTGTIGVVQLLCLTLEMMPCFSRLSNSCSTFFFKAYMEPVSLAELRLEIFLEDEGTLYPFYIANAI